MRPISADLQQIQRANAPRARATVTVEPRGQHDGAPPVAWSELVPNTGQETFWPTAAVGLADGRILKFTADANAIYQHTILDPATPARWTQPTTKTLRTHGAVSLAALRYASQSIRLFYIDQGTVATIQSTDNGASWSTPTTLYTGSAAADLVVAYNTQPLVQNGPWFVGFSTYNQDTGDYTARFGYQSGSTWTTHAYNEPGWRAAGIHPYLNAAHTAVFVFRQQDRGPSRLRRIAKTGSAYANPTDIDSTQAGLFGLGLAYFRFCQLPTLQACLVVAGEYASGAGVYLGIAGLCSTPPTGGGSFAEPLIDEPIIFPAIACNDEDPHPCLCEDASGHLYLVGDTVVYRGTRLPTPTVTLDPTRYRYDDHHLEIDFAPSADAASIRPGQLLVLTRTLSWNGQSGAASLRFIVLAVDHGTTRTRILAVDPLGYLGTARCRRPSILNDGAFNHRLDRVLYRMAARIGLPLSIDHASIRDSPALPITLMPGESLRGLAYRVTSQASVLLVPANDGSFALTAITPPHSASGHYADTPHVYGVAPNEHPIHQARAVTDMRRLAFSYMLGTYSTDPEDGAALAMAEGPVIPGTRPIAYSLTNQRYNSVDRVMAAAQAEAARQRTLPVDAVLTANANLSLEVHDLVEVTEPRLGWSARRLRVRRIAEHYERGRLTQTLYLGANVT